MADNTPLLAQQLLEWVRDKVHGNNIERDQVLATASAVAPATITCLVSWRFSGVVKNERFEGARQANGGHYGYDQHAFQQALSQLNVQAATDQGLRKNFLDSIRDASASSLAWAAAARDIATLPSISVCEECQSCQGHGNISCPACAGQGKVHCHFCHGRGYNFVDVHYQNGNQTIRRQEKELCLHCEHHSGRTYCRGCNGAGANRCQICQGHGCSTHVSHVSAIATPSWNTTVVGDIEPVGLARFVSDCGPKVARQSFPFTLSGGGTYDADNRWQVRYCAETQVTRLDFKALALNYTIVGVGEEPRPFIRPAIFDELFSEELAQLAKLRSSVGLLLTQPQMHQLFAHYRSLPALNSALNTAAQSTDKTAKRFYDAVNQRLENMISREKAKVLAEGIEKTLDGISPANSAAAWFNVMLPALVVFAVVSSIYSEDQLSGFECFLRTGLFAVLAIVAALIYSPLPWLASKVTSYLQRLKVPAAYRQRPRNWEHLPSFLLLAFVSSFVGSGYGHFAFRHNWPLVTPYLAKVPSIARWLPGIHPVSTGVARP